AQRSGQTELVAEQLQGDRRDVLFSKHGSQDSTDYRLAVVALAEHLEVLLLRQVGQEQVAGELLEQERLACVLTEVASEDLLPCWARRLGIEVVGQTDRAEPQGGMWTKGICPPGKGKVNVE